MESYHYTLVRPVYHIFYEQGDIGYQLSQYPMFFTNREDIGNQYSQNPMFYDVILENMPSSSKEQNWQNKGVMLRAS